MLRRLLARACWVIGCSVLLGIGVWAGLVTSAVTKLDRLEARASAREVPGVVLARDNRTVLRRLRAPSARTYLETQDLPQLLVDAVVAAEDRRFFEHSGIDVRGLARAALVDLRARAAREGGSTITQQLVKNTYVGPEQSIARKTREALFAMALETRWSKRRILATYLNTAYFGGGRYGVVDASRGYFGVYPKQLTPAQAALIAALLRAPEGDNPATAPVRARASRDRVLRTMHELGSLDAPALAAALRTPLPTRARLLARTSSSSEIAPQFVDAVTASLIGRFGVRRTLGGGMRVRTTLDAGLQRAANDALERLDALDLDGALVAIDVKSGEVRAMANGGRARRASFNVALNGHRQPGSAFKPFVLAAAYEAGLTPTTRLESAPFRGQYAGGEFRVKNDGGYAGSTTLERATWRSDNTVFARLQDRIGIERGIDMARASGIESEMDVVPAVVLGALPDGVTPTELADAYGTFARHGERIAIAREGGGPRMISIAAAKDTGERWRPTALRREAMPRGVADLVTRTLEGVVRQGTGTRAAIGRPVAGKTGTTEQYRDAWFVGYSPTLVVAVWVGHAAGGVSMRTENAGGPVTGGSIPAAIWHAFMTSDPVRALPGPRSFDLQLPEYVTVRLDPATGLLAGAWCARGVETRVIKGREPSTESSSCTDRLRTLPDVRGLPIDEARTRLTEDEFRVAAQATDELVTDPAQDGLVIAQDPPAGSEVDHATMIRLIVGSSPISP